MKMAIARCLKFRVGTRLYSDKNVGETAFRKRREYVLVGNDPETGASVHLCDYRNIQSLNDFYSSLSEGQRAGIKTVLVEMRPTFFQGALENLPDADNKNWIDRFRVARHLGKVVDKVRRNEHKMFNAEDNAILKGNKHDWL